MKLNYFLYSCIFLLSLKSFSQKNARVIVDSKTKSPIDLVYITSDNKNVYLLSNQDGKFLLPEATVHSLTFYKIGYYKKTMSLYDLQKTDTIVLYEHLIQLADVSVTARIIDTLVKDKRFYVNDYLVLPNSDLLLITSKINIKGFELSYYKKGRGITQTKKIKNETGELLFTDCIKNIHLLTADHSRQIFFDSDSSYDFLPKYARAKFDSTLAPCMLKLDTQIVLKYAPPKMLIRDNYLQNSLFLSYVTVSKYKKDLLYTVMYNKHIREMLAFEMRDEDMLIANAKAFGINLTPAAFAFSHQFFYSRQAATIYAPIFLRNDTIIVFNFQENTIVALNAKSGILKETALDENSFSSLRDFEVIYDAPGKQFYLKTKKAEKTILQTINIYTGELSAEIRLEKMFAKNIQMHNGRIYYLVKEKGWDDTCYLYQQNR